MFSGYDPLGYKLTIWTFSAMMCGVAGALYVPQVGIINPERDEPGAIRSRSPSGPRSAAAPRSSARSSAPSSSTAPRAGSRWPFPEFWLYFLGALFIAVTLFLPNGVVGLVRKQVKERADMTPDLMEEGARRVRAHEAAHGAHKTASRRPRRRGFRPAG